MRLGGVAPCLTSRVLRKLGRETEALQRLPHALAALQTTQDRLRGDRRILRAQVVRHHVRRNELAARQLWIRLLRGFIRALKRVRCSAELRGYPLERIAAVRFRRGVRRRGRLPV